MKRIFVSLFFITFIVYFVSSAGPTPYDYFTRLALAFSEGRIYLSENPPWLNELIPAGENKFFVAYPPMPALIALPIVLILGTTFQQQLLAHALGAAIAVFTAKLAYNIRKDLPEQQRKRIVIWVGLLAAFGNIAWYLAAAGSSWYLGQLTAAFFLTAALVETFGKRRSFLIGLLVGAAYLSRIHTILSVFFFVYFLINKPLLSKENLQKSFLFAAGLLPFLVFNAAYNYVRFGVLWDKGYELIPGVLAEPWYALGLVHPSYIGRHLKVIFTALPVFKNEFPYVFPSWGGLAIWLTTPAFIFAFFAPYKKPVIKLALISIALISLPIIMHGTNGFAQFGYRFALDFSPFIFLILIYALPIKLRTIHWVLLVLSVLVNLWGVVWIRNGWVA